MTEEKRFLLKVISLCLQYPDAQLAEALDQVASVMREVLPAGPEEAVIIEEILSRLQKTPLLELQKEYTRTFDLDPAMTLNLSYHKWGEDKERGRALAQLNQLYKAAGYDTFGGELPDFLPLVLEFLSVCHEEAFGTIAEEYRTCIEAVGSRLGDANSPYAGLFQLIGNFLVKEEIQQPS